VLLRKRSGEPTEWTEQWGPDACIDSMAGEGFEPSKAEPTDLQLPQNSLAQVFSGALKSLNCAEMH
jgi:hypothetical protein